MNKTQLLKILLRLAAVYYLIGSVVHLFGLTLFPFYDGKLYTPYHDTVIALAALLFSLFLFVISKNPIKNVEFIEIAIIGSFIAIIFSAGIIWKIDFTALGAPERKTQTIVEAVLLIIFILSLLLLKPKKSKESS